jgi:pimeloyl-ACP methyl ester carboxylesterase
MQQTDSAPPLCTRSIGLPTGVTLEYVEQGSPEGIPTLLLHGLSDSLRSYEMVLPHLPASIHALAISQRGHGDSSRPATGYTPSDFAADLAAFLDALEIERTVIVGHSMGSTIARRFALDYPERLLGLVLVGSFATLEDKPDVDGLAQAVAELRDPVDPAFVAEFQQSTLAQPVSPEFFDVVVQESLKLPARVWKAVLEGLMGPDHPTDVRSIKAPTLILWGDQDAFCPRSDQDALLAAIAGSRLVVYAGVGHDPQWEQPERFAFDLATFVQGIARRG